MWHCTDCFRCDTVTVTPMWCWNLGGPYFDRVL
jgi:hypothetical protein